jgi:superfamily II DNA or RNA helicase
MLQNYERYLASPHAFDRAREHQKPYLLDIGAFLQRGSFPTELPDRTGKMVPHWSRGAVVDAPGGIGKTALAALSATGLGIGTVPPGIRSGSQPLRLIYSVPSLALKAQIEGKIGKDTFRRLLGNGAKVAGYNGRSTGLWRKADVVVAVQPSLTRDLRGNSLNGQEFDFLFVDEAHHLTAPDFMHAVREQWHGWVLGFTATRSYHPKKDAAAILPYVIHHGDALHYMTKPTDEKVLNAGQFFVFRVDPWEHRDMLPADVDLLKDADYAQAAEELLDRGVVDFAVRMAKEGRNIMISCDAGDNSVHAQHLARLLSEATESDGSRVRLPNGNFINAEPIGVFRTKRDFGSTNREAMQAFIERRVQALTTNQMALESFDAPVDCVIIASNIGSDVWFQQTLFRGTRPSIDFPRTVFAQFFTLAGNPYKRKLIHEVIGLKRIEQGVCVGAPSLKADPARTFKPDRLPGYLRAMSEPLHMRPIGEAFAVNKKVKIPPGFRSEIDIVAGTNYSLGAARRVFFDQGFRWVGQWEGLGERTFIHYYEPKAEAYLLSHPRAAPSGDNVRVGN